MPATPLNDNILKALNQVVQAIIDSIGSCPDVTVNNNVPTPTVTVNVAAPNVTVNCAGSGSDSPPAPYVDDGITPPDGYPDYPAYNQGKCNGAQWFFNSWVQDFTYMQGLDAAALAAGGIALWLVVPGVNIAAIIALVAVLVTGGIVAASMANGRYWIVNNETEIKCAIYNSATAADAKAAVTELVTTSELTLLEKSLAIAFVTQEAMNRSFELSNVPDLGADCAGCFVEEGYPNDVVMSVGSVVATGLHQWQMTSAEQFGIYYIQGAYDVGCTHNSTWETVGWVNTQYLDFRFYSNTAYGILLWEGDTNPSPFMADSWVITSATPFTINLSIA